MRNKIIQHDAQESDTRREIMMCYARAATFLKHYLNTADLSEPPPVRCVSRVFQKLIDLGATQTSMILSLTTHQGTGPDYLIYHHVNTALMAMEFARALGMTRKQMRDVALVALFHETGLSRIPQEYVECAGGLSQEMRDALQTVPEETVLHVLNEKNASVDCLRRMSADMDLARSHLSAELDEKGAIARILKSETPKNLYAQIVAICCAYDALRSERAYRSAFSPKAAILFMWSELRPKFSASLLKVFMQLMFIPPLELKGERAKLILQTEDL